MIRLRGTIKVVYPSTTEGTSGNTYRSCSLIELTVSTVAVFTYEKNINITQAITAMAVRKSIVFDVVY
jgi:hypothetical protein